MGAPLSDILGATLRTPYGGCATFHYLGSHFEHTLWWVRHFLVSWEPSGAHLTMGAPLSSISEATLSIPYSRCATFLQLVKNIPPPPAENAGDVCAVGDRGGEDDGGRRMEDGGWRIEMRRFRDPLFHHPGQTSNHPYTFKKKCVLPKLPIAPNGQLLVGKQRGL